MSPYINSVPIPDFGLYFKCAECDKDLPVLENDFQPTLTLENEHLGPVRSDKRGFCPSHPTAGFYHIYKTELHGKRLDKRLDELFGE